MRDKKYSQDYPVSMPKIGKLSYGFKVITGVSLVLWIMAIGACSSISAEANAIKDCADRNCHRNEMIDLLNPIYKANGKRPLIKDMSA